MDMTMLTVAALIVSIAYAVNVVFRVFSRLNDALMKERLLGQLKPFLDKYAEFMDEYLE